METIKSIFYFILVGVFEIDGFIALVGVIIIMYAPRGQYFKIYHVTICY